MAWRHVAIIRRSVAMLVVPLLVIAATMPAAVAQTLPVSPGDGVHSAEAVLPAGAPQGRSAAQVGPISVADVDSDVDGVPDISDNCMAVANPDQADSNLDGVGDACDADADGWQDAVDNCPSTPNADQSDSDVNGRGDACDQDADRDGVQDGVDNCPNEPNPEQADSDGDGIGTNCDRTVDRLQPDAMIALAASGPFRGQDVYASTPTARQTVARGGAQRGRAYSYTVRIQNDGKTLDRFRVKATLTGSPTMRVSFMAGSTDKTADVVAGRYKTAVLSPGKSSTLTIKVAVSAAAPANADRAVTLKVQSLASGTLSDVVRAITRR